MNGWQRKQVAGSIYDVLAGLQKAGKNENMLKNAYIKFMCWLYYKFERIVNRLGEEKLPKILYEGTVSIYELLLLSVISGAGADVVRKLKAHKVNTDYIRVTKDGMGTWLAIFDNGGDVVAAISKRPDLRPILSILEEQGDEIISRADSIAFEIDMDKEIVKKVFALAEKYHKPVYAVVSNMSIAVERRDFFRSTHCFVCNQQEAGILFSEDYDDKTPEEMQRLLAARIRSAQIPRMVVTMGAQGAVYATNDGEEGWCPAKKVDVKDTTGAGDAFFAGVTIGLTYGKTMAEACEIGTRLAASVICTSENVCPRFLPSEFGIDPSGLEREQLSLEL